MKNRVILLMLICIWLFLCSCARSALPNQTTDADSSHAPNVTESQDEQSPIPAVSSAQKSGEVLHQTCVAELDGDEEMETVELWFVQMGEYVNLTEGDGPLTQFWYPALRCNDDGKVYEYIFDDIPVGVRSTHLFPIEYGDGTKTKIVVALECDGSGLWQQVYVFDYDAGQCQWTNVDFLQPEEFTAHLNADMTVSVLYASGETDTFTPSDEWQKDWREDHKSDPNSVVYPVALTHGGIIDVCYGPDSGADLLTTVQEINGRWKDVAGLICYDTTWTDGGVSIRKRAISYDPDIFAAASPDMKEWHYPQ